MRRVGFVDIERVRDALAQRLTASQLAEEATAAARRLVEEALSDGSLDGVFQTDTRHRERRGHPCGRPGRGAGAKPTPRVGADGDRSQSLGRATRMGDIMNRDEPYPAHWTVQRALETYLEENGFTAEAYDEAVMKVKVWKL
ncbi:MAG: hypothetical protein GWO02_09485, partial [Gammaproteobacteria bacterium]|nr:hypothetical protein [Gammaproteobacteria bacterium]